MADPRFNVQGTDQNTLASLDPIWDNIRQEATKQAGMEPTLASYLHAGILSHDTLESALAFILAQKLSNDDLRAITLRDVFAQAFNEDPRIPHVIRADLAAVYERDPACHNYLDPLIFFKGFHAIQAYRVAHHLWKNERHTLAKYLQSRVSACFSLDIHPAARIGRGIMIDHGHAIVIGETAVIGDDCSLLHGVTLGGTGKATGDRHPKIENGVLIGAGAKILGDIRVGHCSKVASGSVVLRDVPPNSTVAGVPARIVGASPCAEPARAMDQDLPVAEMLKNQPDYSI